MSVISPFGMGWFGTTALSLGEAPVAVREPADNRSLAEALGAVLTGAVGMPGTWELEERRP